MKKRGLARPGALQMISSGILMIIAAIGPVFLAVTRPNHEWMMVLTGFPAMGLSLAGVGVLLLYIFGFLRYCADKGYSKWLGLWLLLGNVFGLVVLLLLPDLNAIKNESTKMSNHSSSFLSYQT